MKGLLRSLICVLLVAGSSRVHSQSAPEFYGYYPTTPFKLGFGLSPNNIAAWKQTVLDFDTIDDPVAQQTSFDLYWTRNAFELKQALKIDTKVDASYLVFKGSGSFNLNESFVYNSDSITVVATGATEFGYSTVKNARLTDPAIAFVKAGKYDELFDKFGSRVVTAERRGVSISTIIHISNISSNLKVAMSSSSAGKGGSLKFSASMKIAIEQELQAAIQQKRISVSVVAAGGDGIKDLSELLTALSSPTPFDRIQEILSQYMSTLGYEKSVLISFRTAPLSDFFPPDVPVGPDLYSEEKDRRLIAMVERYRKLLGEVDQLEVMKNGGDPTTGPITPELAALIEEERINHIDYLGKLAEAHRACRETASSDLNNCVLPVPDPPLQTPDELIGPIFYSNDFEKMPAFGTEWFGYNPDFPNTVMGISNTQTGRKFAGRFTAGNIHLQLQNLPPHHDVVLSFKLFIMGSWNGNGAPGGALDQWMLYSSNNERLIGTTFSNDSGSRQAYPGSVKNFTEPIPSYAAQSGVIEPPGSLGEKNAFDSVYQIVKVIPDPNDSIHFEFSTRNIDPDETWGLDDVVVRLRSPLALKISPEKVYLKPKEGLQFAASSTRKVTWTVEGGGDVDKDTGYYQAPSNLTADRMQAVVAKDDLGRTAQATVVLKAMGDINKDGKIDISDAILLLRYLVELEVLTPEQLLVADMNSDNAYTIGDAVFLLRKIVGLD